MNTSKKEPEDILAEVDKTVVTRKKAAKTPSPQSFPLGRGEGEGALKVSSHRPYFVISGIIVIVILIALAGYIMLSQRSGGNIAATNTNVNSQKTNANANANAGSNTNFAVNNAAGGGAIFQKISNDADSDGLTNEEEAKAGTDSKNPDTDSDGLSDREEVKTWKTNPLKADTDGDGYDDGLEIKTLNDPKVPGGKLLDLNKAIQQLNTNK